MLTLFYTRFSGKLPPRLWDSLLAGMPGNLQHRINRITRWQDRQSALFGKLLLIAGLAEYGQSQDCLHNISYDAYGRPCLAGGVDFNIAHSGEFTVCCLSDDGRVGVDIEEIKPINLQDFQYHMTPEQMANINKSKDVTREFYKYWTIKESVVKADGRALTLSLAEIIIEGGTAKLFDKLWFVKAVDINKGYECHIATDTENQGIYIRELKPFSPDSYLH